MNALWSQLKSWFGGASASGAPEFEPGGLIGAKLADVQARHDFFTFFHFAPLSTEKLPDATQLTAFKPTGEAFRALVTLNATTDQRGLITRLQLTVLRSFIEDPRQCIYAADLVKSFLLAAVPTAQGDTVHSLAIEINARSMARSSMPMITTQPLPQVPEFPSAAYQTYVARERSGVVRYQSGKWQVQLRNDTADGNAVLHLIVAPAP